jgi:RNA polymerase sigma factor (sigma-70 family)
MKPTLTWQNRLGELLEQSRLKGFVTYDEINDLFGDTTVESEEIETVLGVFAAAGVLVVDEGALDTGAFRSGRIPDKPEDDVDEGVLDPVEAYMRDIERLIPLPAEEEDALIRQLAEGLTLVAEAVLSTAEGRERLSIVVGAKVRSPEGPTEDTVPSALFHGDSPPMAEDLLRKLRDLGVGIAVVEDAAFCIADSDDRLITGKTKLEDARKRLVEGHIRLVPYLARRYSNRGVEYLDLLQEGNTGLVRAAQRFNPLKDQRFAAYATWWIRQAMTKAINEQGRAVRIPQMLIRERKRLNRATEELRQELSRDPTRAELAEALGVDVERVHLLIDMTKSPMRLDHPSGDSDALPLGEVIDLGAEDWTTTPLFQLMKRELQDVLTALDPHEQEVMRLRFGLDDDEPCTLAEICKRLRMSKERVRRLEATALLKLRHPDHRERLPKPP